MTATALSSRVAGEPGALALGVRALAAERPQLTRETLAELLAGGLWRAWREELEPCGWSENALLQVIRDNRREAWLWAVGDRDWAALVDGIAGRLARRDPRR